MIAKLTLNSMKNGTTAYIGLGSNLGDRQSFIQKALAMLAEADGIKVIRTSDIIKTNPLADEDQGEYLNAVTEIETSLNADSLYEKTAEIERTLGRVRQGKWQARTIDLDLLLYGSLIINTETLTLPHPQMHLRSFVLTGLNQLAPDLRHPVMKEKISTLASRLNGQNFALNPDSPQLVSIAGVIGVGKTTLAEKLSKNYNAELILEPYDTNPFLPDVYAGNKELALNSQLFFLVSRTERLNPENLQKGKLAFCDYVFEKEPIYAKNTLTKEQLSIYEKIYPPCKANSSESVLVIYLEDSAKNCLQRIHSRNRPYEQQIESEFLEKLNQEYDKLFSNWKKCPVIRIAKSEFDCHNSSDIEHLATQIEAYAAVGK